MDYVIADIRKITKSIRPKTFEQKILDVILDKKLKTTQEKSCMIKQIIRSEDMRTLAKRIQKGSI